jgi:hypothetical protein
VRDRPQLAHVGHDDFMTQLLQLLADPSQSRHGRYNRCEATSYRASPHHENAMGPTRSSQR